MSLKSIQQVEEVPYGVYRIMSNGKYVVDNNKSFLCIASTKGDLKKKKALIDAAESYGLRNLQLEWVPGARLITDEEYEEQSSRLKFGLVPDPLDLPSIKDELEGLNDIK